MRSMIRNLILAPVVLAAAALTTNTAMAATNLKVPFSFTVDGQNWPAGMYTVEQDVSSNLVTLRSQDGTKSFSGIIGPGEPAPTDVRIALKFDEVGSTHVLRAVQYRSQITSRLDKNTKQTMYAPTRLSQGR
jgi:hypothetical protein